MYSRRAVDTLDLQDQDNPTASEHQKPQSQTGLAPHQASQLHHVDEERHEEEQSLAEAWNIAANLADEPGAIDQAQANAEHEHEHMTNGTQQDGEEGGGGGESEAEGDDDLMDRISSSPSIDDGGYSLHSSPPAPIARLRVWPTRSSSLSPTPTPTVTPTRGDFNSSASPTSTVESSPFLRTPQHMPLRRAWMEKEASPLSKAMD